MNLLDIFEQAKTAKTTGKKFEYPGTPVKFEFRAFSSKETRRIIEILKGVEKSNDVDAVLQEIIKINPLVGWEGMTKGLLKEISSLALSIPEEEMTDEIPYEDQHSQSMLATCAGFDGKEIRNVPFLSFISESVKRAGELRAAEVEAKKNV